MQHFLFVFIPALIIGLASLSHSQYHLDDALIYARYIRNAVSGAGFAYNPGEIWGGVTSPLHSYLQYLCAIITGDVLLSQRILSGVFYLLATYAGSLLLLTLTPRFIPAFFFSLLLPSSVYFYSIYGMESFLFIALLAFSLFEYEKSKYLKRPVLLSILLSLLVLTRGEGIFLIATLLAVHLKKKRPMPDWTIWLIPISICCGNIIIQYALFGTIFAETMGAKIAQGASGLWGGHFAFLKGVKMYVWYFGHDVSVPFVLCVILTGFGFLRAIKLEPIQVYFTFLCLLTLFYLSLAIPFYHWYYAPFIYFAYFLIAYGLGQIFSFFKESGFAFHFVRIASVIFVVFIFWQQGKTTSSFVQQRHNSPYKQIGLWLERNTPLDAKVASVEVGALGWYSNRYIIDILGLTTPLNAAHVARRDFNSWAKSYSAAYMLIHTPRWQQESAADTFLAAGAIPITRGIPEGFILLKINKNIS